MSVLWDYNDEDWTDKEGYFKLLTEMCHSGVAKDSVQLARLVKELDDQLGAGGILGMAIEDAQTSGELLGLRSRERGLQNFRAKARAILAESSSN